MDQMFLYISNYLTIKKTHLFRKKLCQYLESKKIETRPMMAGCLPDQPAFHNKPGKIIGNLKTLVL